MSEIDEESKQEMRNAIERLRRDAKFRDGELALLNEEAAHMKESIEQMRTALARILVLPEQDPNSLRCIETMTNIARKALAWPTDESRV